MAKGLRSSVKKSNRTKLRSRVFAPVEDARTQRLHEKLLAIAQQPKPEPSKKSEMEVDSTEVSAAQETSKEDEYPKEMEVDDGAAPTSTRSKKKRADKSKKRRHQKPRNMISFPKTRGKGALKPFSESRVRKRR